MDSSEGFDNDRYLKTQSEHIRERISKFGGKLYLEFGGKLFDDYHASRVLPGFKPDSKISMLMQFGSDAEAIVVISAEDVVKNKIRKDIGIGYDLEVFRLVDSFRDRGIDVCGLVITRYTGQPAADNLQKKAEALSLGGTTAKAESDGTAIKSQSNDGVSITYNSMSSYELFKACETDALAAIDKYLNGVMNELGRKLLYRGLYPGE